MPLNTPVDDDLANTLWLHARHTVEQVRAADAAADRMNTLVHEALAAGSDAETVADATFIDVDLVRFIATGGTTSEYLRTRQAP